VTESPGRLFVISGPGGVGKDTIANRLIAEHDHVRLSRSWTTRPRRPREPADAYTFVDRDEFERHREQGGFLEWAEYLGNLYGTPQPDLSDGDDLLLVIEVQGAQQVLDRVPGAVMILVVPPSLEAQQERLRRRGDSPAQQELRVAAGIEEERIGRTLAQHVVVNDDLDRAVAEVAGILARYRNPCEGA
jgi:guanylate kinase